MHKFNRSIQYTLFILIVSILSVTMVYANSAEPPGFTVIAYSLPDDLSISLSFEDGNKENLVLLKKDQKAWETYYKFFYHMIPSRNIDFEDAILIVQSSEKSFQCNLPSSTFNRYNNILRLDMKHETLTMGQPILRIPLLISLRIAFTLLIEGLLFFLFGYRKKASWIAFLIINLITQGGLNMLLSTPNSGYLWIFIFLCCEFIILIIELITFPLFVKEYEKSKTMVYVIIANLMSLVIGGTLISYLPI